MALHRADLLAQRRGGLRVAALLGVARFDLQNRQRRLQTVREIACALASAPHQVFLPRQQLVEVGDERLDLARKPSGQARIGAAVHPCKLVSDHLQRTQPEARLNPCAERKHDADDAERQDDLAFE